MSVQTLGGSFMKKFMKWICLTMATVACAMFAACAPSNLNKAEAKMEEAGYTVIELPAIGDSVGGINATKISGWTEADSITAYLFETSEEAKEFLADWDKWVGEGTAVQSGKWIYAGSEDAVKAFTAFGF